MQVNDTAATSTAAAANSSSAGKSKTVADYQMFLKLLIAELKHQDPTNPSDPTQYVTQIATFSGVEAQVNANTKLDALLAQSSLAQASAVIGRSITSSDGQTTGKIAAVNISSDGAVALLEDGQKVTLGSGVTLS